MKVAMTLKTSEMCHCVKFSFQLIYLIENVRHGSKTQILINSWQLASLLGFAIFIDVTVVDTRGAA